MSLSTERLDILNYCLIVFNIIISFIILNWTICFSLLRQYPCIKSRQPIIPILIGIFNCIFVGIDRSQILIHSNLTQPIKYEGWIIVNTVLIQIWILTLFLVAYRGYIIYYQIKFNKSLQDKQWRLYINPAENNWFLKHRKTYGNPKKMIFPFIIPWIITASIYWIEIIKQNEFTIYSRYIIISQAFVIMILLIYIWYKMPKFDDLWRMRSELIIAIRLLLIGLAIFFVLGIMLNWQPPTWQYGVLSTIATLAAFGQCYAVLYFPLKRFKLPKFVYGAYILSKATMIRKKMELSQSNYKKKQSLGTIENVEDENGQTLSTQFFKLKSILLHKDGFRLFAAHLMKEFAIENLLFFVESSQWLEYVMSKCLTENINISIDEKESGIDVKFHKNVPKSRIVRWNRDDDRLIPIQSISTQSVNELGLDTDSTGTGTGKPGHEINGNPSTTLTATKTLSSGRSSLGKSRHSAQLTIDLNLDEFELGTAITDPWLQCVKIFQKYVINGSYFCINISGENRIELYEQFGYDASSTKCDDELLLILKEKLNNDYDKLFHIFDTARYAVFRLMIYSVSRFESSNAYLEHFIPLNNT